MRITVKDRVVKHNLELLKSLLQRSRHGKCKAWIETTTGEISTKPPTGEEKKRKWRAVKIQLAGEPSLAQPALMIEEDTKTSEEIFDFSGWAIRARRVVLETVQTINTRLATLPRGEKSEEFLARFAVAQITLMRQGKEKTNLILEAWHNIDRVGAEKALEGHPGGTYLFRKDDYTALLEQELFNRFDGTVHYCVTLTYLDETGIVRDKTLVQREKYLVIFNDNPNLMEPHFATLEDAMRSIDPSLSRPLKTLKRAA